MSEGPLPKLPADWLAENARFTGFYSAKPNLPWSEIFTEVFGQPPSTELKQFGDLLTKLDATKDGIAYTLAITPVRIDMIASPDITVQSSQPRGPVLNIGQAQSALRSLEAQADKFAQRCPGFDRYALGLVGLLPRNTNRDAYLLVQTLLNEFVELDVDNSSDFFYRINRPRTVKLGARPVKINRISTWASVNSQTAAFVPNAEGPKFMSASAVNAVRVEIDISSPADSSLNDMTPEERRHLIDLFALFTEEILTSGDRK